jgi:CRP-like cAMP-binding protein
VQKQTPDFDLLLKNVRRHIRLDEEQQSLLVASLEPKSIKKKTILLKAGEVCRHSIFVVEGALKSHVTDEDSNEHVINFAVSGWWIADMNSLITEKPAVQSIEAIADSKVLLLSRRKQESLYQTVPQFERFFRILAENALVANQQRVINNLTLTAGERYLQFIDKYRLVVDCAPLHNIASYLGMTPEFLSKIRRRLAGKRA